ncbi:unnamed protein product [Lota lota]
MRRCFLKSQKEDEDQKGRLRVLTIAALGKSSVSGVIEEGMLKMLSHMNDDNIARVVRNDFGLLQFANSLYNKHGQDKSKHEYIRQKIRELGRFLITLRKTRPDMSLEDAVKPIHFMDVIKAVKETAGFNKDQHTYRTPSLALKIGHSLLKVGEIFHCHALMTEDTELAQCTKAFRKLYQTKWAEYISHTALCTISESKYNKPTKLPLTEDIQALTKHLQQHTESAFPALKKEASEQNYHHLARLTLTQIILFNRRRVGEVSKMTLKNFLEKDDSYAHQELGLSAYEKSLCNHFTRVELKGKRERRVAVLLTPETKKALDLLIENRKECGVLDENQYLFARPRCMTHYRGHDCLKKFASECGARKPEYLRSTQLRKQVATTSQILNLKNNEMDQLADFLGHDIRVHREYYRLPEATVQVAKISKLLLALESGKLLELRGKGLDDLEDDGDDDSDDDDDDDSNNEHDHDLEDNFGATRSLGAASESNEPVRVTKKAYVKKAWTAAEVTAVMKHFKHHIKRGHLATKSECEACRKAEQPILKRRTIQNIRDFVRNKGMAMKRKTAH